VNRLIDWLIDLENTYIFIYISFSDGTNNILLQILLCSITKYEWMNEWMNEWLISYHISNTY